ncbi:MAG TPA: ornithine cyclodeaminase family protein [Streptosporangiaceae bacterium]|jgi:ornithine cyclodeaminase
MSEILLLGAADVEAVFDLPAAIESQRAAFAALGSGEARLAPRLLLPGPGPDDVAFCYVSRLPGTGTVAKFGSVHPGNAERGLPSVSALIIVQDRADGRPIAIIEGEAVTTLRTAAASAVAVDHLAPPDAARLAVIGTGVQARAHVRAIAAVRPIAEVRICGRSTEAATDMATELASELGIPVAADTAKAAVGAADIVATCTTSKAPVVHGAWLNPGCTVVSVGSFAPDRTEVDVDLLTRAAAVMVDDPATAREQAGPVVAALAAGSLTEAELIPLGSVVAGRGTARRSPDDIVFYNSVGLGIQDTAAAAAIVEQARAAGVGRTITV